MELQSGLILDYVWYISLGLQREIVTPLSHPSGDRVNSF